LQRPVAAGGRQFAIFTKVPDEGVFVPHVIALVGDVYIDRPDPETVFDGCRDVVGDASFWLGNLEAPLTTAGEEDRDPSRLWAPDGSFKSPPATAQALTALTAVSLANNHVMDFGVRGYLDTIDHLDQVGVGHAGGGRDLQSARRPFVAETDGLTIAFLAYACVYQPHWRATDSRPGMAGLRVLTSYELTNRVLEQPHVAPRVRSSLDPGSKREVLDDIAAARSQADLVIVSVHWGVSQGNYAVVEYQYELARSCVDAGAQVVFGHHPHVLQPMEVYNDGVIFYSLGNFVFDRLSSWFDRRSVIARCYVERGQVVGVGLIPIGVDDSVRPIPCDGDTSDQILEMLLSLAEGEPRKISARTRTGRETIVKLA
jgi:poly-gamma-glutamate synthesis protein (capsule biosynthesis protein)